MKWQVPNITNTLLMVFIRWSGWAHFGRFQMVPQWWTMPMWLWPCPDWLPQTNAMSFLQEQQHWHLTLQSQHSQPLFVLLRVGKSDNRGHVLPRCHLLRLLHWYPHIWGNHCNQFKDQGPFSVWLCSANHRAGYFSNLSCDWLSIVCAYSQQETETGPGSHRWNLRYQIFKWVAVIWQNNWVSGE